jgi:prepilin-type N-terminal cleavage/methylation domain-containing protein
MLERVNGRQVGRTLGFTMIELLVVIVVIGLLIGLVTAVAGKAIRQQKVRNTRQIMQNATLALEQFATENPLRQIYDKKGRETFGKFPPYQLANATTSNSVGRLVEPAHLLGSGASPASLAVRLALDLSGQSTPTGSDWVVIGKDGDADYPDGHDDVRALHAYLAVFSPGSTDLIPEDRLKPIDPQDRDYVNPTGAGTAPGDEGVLDVLGIHDAWGVPLDYVLYLKCEWGLVRNPLTGQDLAGFRVVERKPVLRSRGIEREVYDTLVESGGTSLWERRENWIFSEDLPRPWAAVNAGGVFQVSGTSGNGWVRAVGLNEDYAYRPDSDSEPPP